MIMDTVDATVTTTMATPNARPMGIEMKSLRWILSSLTDIYEDGVLACIREYSSNARDAHEVAGQTRPIEVTLPSAFNPNFKVRDWGTGMTYDELYTYCGQYGASTKREDKDALGFFGLGFKSALTVVPQFTVVSVKDGMKHFATITRGPDTVGVLDVISSTPTDEPNGFEVTIPAGKASEFAARADEFFMTWKPGTVLINGKEPKSFHKDGFEKVGELGYIGSRNSANRNGNTVTVVMGGIGYKLTMSWDLRRELFGQNERSLGFSQIFVNVPIGAVELVPNREALKLSDITKSAVKKHLEALIEAFTKQVASKISNAPSRMDALREIENFGYAFTRTENKWKGESIPSNVATTATMYAYSNGRRAKYSTAKASIQITSLAKKNSTIFVETGSVSGDNSLALRHIASYAKAKDFTLAKVYMGTLGTEINPWVQEMIDAEFIHFVKVEDMVAAAKVYNKENRAGRSASGTSRETLTYPVGMATENGTTIDSYTTAEIDAFTGPVYYVHEERYGNGIRVRAFDSYTSGESVKLALRVLGNKAKLVFVAANRKPSSLESRLKSVKISNVVPALERNLTKTLKREFSAADRLAYFITSTGAGTLATTFRILAQNSADDPVFGTVDKILTDTDNDLRIAIRDAKTLLGWNSDTINALFKKDTGLSGAELQRNLFAHYPLLRVFVNANPTSLSPEEKADFIEYFNTVFATRGAFKL